MQTTLPTFLSLILSCAPIPAAADDVFRCPPEARDSGYRPGNVVRWCEVQKDGRLMYHGPVWRWHRNGRQESKANYIYGAAEGDTPSWHESGTMSSHGAFKNGQKVGLWKYWDEQGRITTEVAYADSGHQRTDYYPTGKQKASGVFVSSGKIGKWIYWNADGKETANCDFGTGVFAVTTRACQVIADELDPEGFSRPIPVGSLNADGTCSLRIADEHYVFGTPPGWVADAEAGKTDGASLVFYPAGGTWRGDNANLYVRVLFKAGRSFETVLRQEAEGFSENVAEYMGYPFSSTGIQFADFWEFLRSSRMSQASSCADSVLLVGDVPNGSEPDTKLGACLVENSSRRCCSLMSACRAN